MEKSKIKKITSFTEKEINAVGSKELAYLGDSVYELEIRAALIKTGIRGVKELNIASNDYVSALSQAKLFDKIEPLLTNEEYSVYKRGRNTKIKSSAKNTDKNIYRIATGLECIFGYLYLKKDFDRISILIDIIFDK